MKALTGFTLIELIIVIAVLAILAAVAIPKYINLTKEAKLATAEGFAGALTSASSLNYNLCQKNESGCISSISNCHGFAALLNQQRLPSGMKISDVDAFPASGNAAECQISYGKGNIVEFKALVP